MATDAGVWLVRAAIEEAVGDRQKASEVLCRPSRRLENRTPLEVARQPGGANVVLAELHEIVLEDAGRP